MGKLVNLYIDIDNVILNTAETFIEYYTKKNNIDKNFYNLKDWNFRSIDRNIDKQEFLQYIETNDFFEKVKINEDFLRFYIKNADKYYWIFNTTGTLTNIRLKREYILRSLPILKNVKFIGVYDFMKKSDIDMTDGIQIDDEYKNLNTNAKYKILLKNLIETDYNQLLDIREDVYIANTFDEVIKCVECLSKEIEDDINERRFQDEY